MKNIYNISNVITILSTHDPHQNHSNFITPHFQALLDDVGVLVAIWGPSEFVLILVVLFKVVLFKPQVVLVFYR